MKKIDLAGQRFGRWTVIGENPDEQSTSHKLICKCDCGNVRTVLYGNLRSGKSKSCGCLRAEKSREIGMGNSKDIAGIRFGRLIAIKRSDNKDGHTRWLCGCDCGNQITARTDYLLNGSTKSCGCLASECTPPNQTVHGMSRSKLYKVWMAMRQRCGNPRDKNYHRYGGRGIVVCDEWQNSFEAFRDWALNHGYISGKVDLDRIDNDKGYSPDNCRFVSHQINLCNTHRKVHSIINGEDITLSDAAKKYGISYRLLYQRYKRGKRGDDLIARN